VITALVIVVSYAGFASPLVVLMTFVASLCCALSIAEFARRLPSAGWAYTYNSPLGPLVTPGRFGQRALAHVAGTSAPPSSVIRASKRSSAGWGEIFPAIRPSPWRKVTERSIRLGGTNENAASAKAESASEFSRRSTRLSAWERTFSGSGPAGPAYVQMFRFWRCCRLLANQLRTSRSVRLRWFLRLSGNRAAIPGQARRCRQAPLGVYGAQPNAKAACSTWIADILRGSTPVTRGAGSAEHR